MFQNGRYWIRTSDPFRVKEVRYRCANRPLPRRRRFDEHRPRWVGGHPFEGPIPRSSARWQLVELRSGTMAD